MSSDKLDSYLTCCSLEPEGPRYLRQSSPRTPLSIMLSNPSFDLPICQEPGTNTNLQGRIVQQTRAAQLPDPYGPGPHHQKPSFHRGHRHTQSQPCWPSAPRHYSSRSHSWPEHQVLDGRSFPLNRYATTPSQQSTIDEELDQFLTEMSSNGSMSSSVVSMSSSVVSMSMDMFPECFNYLATQDVNADQRTGRTQERSSRILAIANNIQQLMRHRSLQHTCNKS